MPTAPSKACGARTRAGTPCKKKGLANGRCRLHGGLATGPRSAAGRARIAEAQRKRWAEWRVKHPRLFKGEVSARQERKIKKVYRDLRRNLIEVEPSAAEAHLIRRFGPDWYERMNAALESQIAEQLREREERKKRAQERAERAKALSAEAIVDADKFLDNLMGRLRAPKPAAVFCDQYARAREAPPPARMTEVRLDRQPVERLKALVEDEAQREHNAEERQWWKEHRRRQKPTVHLTPPRTFTR